MSKNRKRQDQMCFSEQAHHCPAPARGHPLWCRVCAAIVCGFAGLALQPRSLPAVRGARQSHGLRISSSCTSGRLTVRGEGGWRDGVGPCSLALHVARPLSWIARRIVILLQRWRAKVSDATLCLLVPLLDVRGPSYLDGIGNGFSLCYTSPGLYTNHYDSVASWDLIRYY